MLLYTKTIFDMQIIIYINFGDVRNISFVFSK